MFDLENKSIIITGAAGLLGLSFVEAIIKFNGNPIMLDIDEKKLIKNVNKLKKKYKRKIEFFVLDITNEKDVEYCYFKIKKLKNSIFGLVNNAALNPKYTSKKINNSLENFDTDRWNKEINVSLTGSYLCSKYFSQLMMSKTKGGVIINISSDLGLIGPNQNIYSSKLNKEKFKPISYSVAKSGIIGLTKYLSTYWPEKNIRCNAICPGGIEDDQPKLFVDKLTNLIPLKRMAKKNEYQSTLIWMLSDQSSYLNGSIISIDGGRTAW